MSPPGRCKSNNEEMTADYEHSSELEDDDVSKQLIVSPRTLSPNNISLHLDGCCKNANTSNGHTKNLSNGSIYSMSDPASKLTLLLKKNAVYNPAPTPPLPARQTSSLRSPDSTSEPFDPQWTDEPDSGHPFTKAVINNDIPAVKEITQRQTFDPTSKKAQHCLLIACRSGFVEITKILLDAGVDVHSKDVRTEWQAIHFAAYQDKVKIVELLLSYGDWGAQRIALAKVKGVTCFILHVASHYGCYNVLKLLLNNLNKLNLSVDIKDAGHWTSLHHAVCESRVRTVDILLEAGADVNIADPHGITPLHVAAQKNNLGLFRLLMEKGANPKITVINAGGTNKFFPPNYSPVHARRSYPLPLLDIKRDDPPVIRISTSFDQATKSLGRKRRCWSPMMTRPNLEELPAAQTHCLNLLKGSFSTSDLTLRVEDSSASIASDETGSQKTSNRSPKPKQDINLNSRHAKARHKFSLSGSPPNSPRASPPVSPFASRLNPPHEDITSFPFQAKLNFTATMLRQEKIFERAEKFIRFHEGSTLLHWAASRGHYDIVADLLARGLKVDARDSRGRSPLGVTMWAGHGNVVATLNHEKLLLTDEDKNWEHIASEEVGLCILQCIVETGVCELTASRQDGYSLLHLAAQKGYPNMMHRLLSLKVNPDLHNSQGETPLFVAIKHNQLACVQQLLNAGTKLSSVDNRGGSALHIAAKMGNVTVVDMLLTNSESEEKNIDINKCDNIGYTPVYYAINASRYDIVQRFLEYSLVRKVHVKATNSETLLQFFTERNNLGQFDNALVRVLECEQLLHACKSSAEMCLRVQLGTTEASTKARSQLQAMYESTRAQRHCWNFWFFLSCFFVPSLFYFLDVYTDVLLAFEYYKDFKNATANSTMIDGANVNSTFDGNFREEDEKTWMTMFENFVENQDKTNFVLTVFFILFPFALLSLWSFYIHITQPDIIPIFKNVPSFIRVLFYVLVFPLSPIMVYMENTYAQMKHMNVTTRQMQEQADSKSYNNFPGGQPHAASSSSTTNSAAIAAGPKTYRSFFRHHMRDQKIRKYYDLKHVAQMRVAITNVMEATLESAFQLILQLYIVGTQYTDLIKVREVTIGAILTLSSDGSTTRLGKQVFSVLISLVSLTWSFTSYHRFSKLGGLTILSALPLLFAIFFQVVSRAIACTIFTLAYTWRIFVVLGVHFLIVLGFKLRLEERSLIPPRPQTKCNCLFAKIRPYFYVFLGTIASTLVYFRLERPSVVKKQLSRRHSTVVIQVLFLMLAFLENFILLSLGLAGLDRKKYDTTFMACAGAICVLSYIIGVVLHAVYYACFGHPWVDINGPKIERDEDEKRLIVSYYRQGKMNKLAVSMNTCCEVTHREEDPTDDVYGTPEMQLNGGIVRQLKDI